MSLNGRIGAPWLQSHSQDWQPSTGKTPIQRPQNPWVRQKHSLGQQRLRRTTLEVQKEWFNFDCIDPLPTLAQHQTERSLPWPSDSPLGKREPKLHRHPSHHCQMLPRRATWILPLRHTGCAWTPRNQTGMEKGFTAYSNQCMSTGRPHFCW